MPYGHWLQEDYQNMFDFSKFSLGLEKEGKIIHTSKGSGLRPLVECIKKFKGRAEGCTLHDKVHGLAAAKLVVYSGFISKVETTAASEQAVAYLGEQGIAIVPRYIVKNILMEDMATVCPGEIKARGMSPSEFFAQF